MRIIIIILAPIAGLGTVFFVFGGMFLLMFSSSGDYSLNSINTVTTRKMCYPSLNSVRQAVAFGNDMDSKGFKNTEKNINAVMDRFDIIWLEKGSKVKINGMRFGVNSNYERFKSHRYNSTHTFISVVPTTSSNRSCLTFYSGLEMELWDWIKWKWSKRQNS